nr:unnamed protein product [Digitaria exilis]
MQHAHANDYANMDMEEVIPCALDERVVMVPVRSPAIQCSSRSRPLLSEPRRTGQDCRGLDRRADVVHADGTRGRRIGQRARREGRRSGAYDLRGGHWAGLAVAVAAASTGDTDRNAGAYVDAAAGRQQHCRGRGGGDVEGTTRRRWMISVRASSSGWIPKPL